MISTVSGKIEDQEKEEKIFHSIEMLATQNGWLVGRGEGSNPGQVIFSDWKG